MRCHYIIISSKMNDRLGELLQEKQNEKETVISNSDKKSVQDKKETVLETKAKDDVFSKYHEQLEPVQQIIQSIEKNIKIIQQITFKFKKATSESKRSEI